MRAIWILGPCLGYLITVGLAACDSDLFNGVVSANTVCRNDAGVRVPCCGPPGEKYACPPDAGDDADADAGNDVDAGEDDEGPGSACPEPAQCITPGGGGFDDVPSYVWMGKETDPPPPPLPAERYESWVDVVFAEPMCPTCSCAAPAPGCVVPTSWDVHSTSCQDISSSTVTSFDPLAGWDGSCSSSSQIPAGVLCDGLPCVRSLVVEPPNVAPCVAEPAMPPEGQPLPPPVRTKVIEYVAASVGTCDLVNVCLLPPPPGYRLCRVAYGLGALLSCPKDWSDRHDGWTKVEEQRVCSACNCGAPQGGACSVRVRAYAEESCTNEQGSLVLPSTEAAKCVDLPVGTALASQTAEVLLSEPGTCEPGGGEVIGAPYTGTPVTYCCVPELAPPP
jgi:hypothetical protein